MGFNSAFKGLITVTLMNLVLLTFNKNCCNGFEITEEF